MYSSYIIVKEWLFLPKTGNEARMSALPALIQYSAVSLGWSSKAKRKREERQNRGKTVPICKINYVKPQGADF